MRFSDIEDIGTPSPLVLSALKNLAAKVHACAVLGVPLPTAVVEARDRVGYALAGKESDCDCAVGFEDRCGTAGCPRQVLK